MTSVPTDGLRDKRPQFLQVFQSEYAHFQVVPKGTRAYAMAVYMCLASHANSKTDTVFPSHATICTHTGLSKNTVIKALDALTASGHIAVQQRFHKGERSSNLYTLLVVVHDVTHQDIVGQGVTHLGHQATQVGNDVTQVGRDMHSTHTNEPEPMNQNHEQEKGLPPVSLRSTSPTGDARTNIERIRSQTLTPEEQERRMRGVK